MTYRILSINPGSTSTKIAVYNDEKPMFVKSIEHDIEELAPFKTLNDQFPLRRDYVMKALSENGVEPKSLAAVVGRGGMLPPVKAGGYLVNKAMIDLLYTDRVRQHASNLGALIAQSVAKPLGIPAYIYDAVASDELYDVARITGFPEVRRQSFCHVLNSKAAARKVAAKLGGTYGGMNFIVAHIGGGISISAHENGRIVDVIADDAGPFSPERSGSLPIRYIIDMCYGGKFTKQEFMDKIVKSSGLKGHLGTNDCREIEKRIAAGDKKAAAVYEAEAYQISKGIGELAPVICGKIDAVIITGGMAYSEYITSEISRRVGYLGRIEIVPGENEMESLTLGALRILRGEETALEYSFDE